MSDLASTNTVESYEDLVLSLCWDDDEDPHKVLSAGVYKVCGGEWRREEGGRWRFWEDPIIRAEMERATFGVQSNVTER
jgi:hypothetical protein